MGRRTATMSAINSRTAENIHDLLAYQVLDQAGNEVGTLHSFWADTALNAPSMSTLNAVVT